MEELYKTYKDKAQFLIVYIKEAHAKDSARPLRFGPQILTPKTIDERVKVAQQCSTALNFTMPMVIDQMDDKAAKLYGGHPDRLYIIGKDGRIAYQGFPGPFGFKPDEMEGSLKKIIKNKGVRRAWRF